MYTHHHWQDDTQEEQAAGRQTESLAAVVVVLLLLIGGLFLVHQLRAAAKFQDCLLSGRGDCDSVMVYQQ